MLTTSSKTFKALLSILGGILMGITMKYFLFPLGWVCLVPFLIVLKKEQFLSVVKHSALFGGSYALVLFIWMDELVQKYSDSSTQTGLFIVGISVAYCMLWFILFGVAYSILIPSIKKHFFQALVVGSLWITLEWLNTQLLTGIPWLAYVIGHTQSTNIYMIQTASFGGVWIVGFIVTLVNYSLYIAYNTQTIKPIIYAGSLLIIVHLLGLLMVRNNSLSESHRSIKVAIINENLPSSRKWDPKASDSISNLFLELNRKATLENPQLIVWSESAVPYMLNNGDQFLTKILKTTYPSKASHLIGVLYPHEKDTSLHYNAACFIQPNGAITARNDKFELLKVLETPFIKPNWKITFQTEDTPNNLCQGSRIDPIKTKYGTIGIIICNEILLPYIAKNKCLQKAEYLVLMANDGWFSGNSLVKHHFYITRFRAIENRKDILINCNKGFSGKISSNGTISSNFNSTEPQVITETVNRSRHKTFYTKHGDIIIFLFITLLLFTLKNNLLIKKRLS